MNREQSKIFYIVNACFGLVIIIFFLFVNISKSIPVHANSDIDTLRNQINESNNRLEIIEVEIAGYKADLQKVGSEKDTLQKTITRLQLEGKKIQADINYTQNKIGFTDLEINKLILEIQNTENNILLNKKAISETLQSLHEFGDNSIIEILLQHENLSEFWSQLDELDQVRSVIATEVTKLASQKELLDKKYNTTTLKRSDLVDLKKQYSDQNVILVDNTTTKNQLLSVTKNKESNYQKMLKEKESAKELILKEMREFESKLQFILDPNSIPKKGTLVFNWPLTSFIITQYFGGTEFAKNNSSIYGGRPYHPGLDLAVPMGTKIYAPLSGTVRATGNTDLVAGCYSWGKWTLIDHANGLSTLYAHQSNQAVSPGQQVNTGDIIGYSGNSGFSTGPHLHFTVYAKSGVSVRKFNEIKAVTSCGAATTPIAAADAYVDPMVYLPPQ